MYFAHFSHVWNKADMTPTQRYQQLWRELELCDELGYDYGFSVEHHFRPDESWMTAPNLYAVAAGARTRRIRLGAMGHIVPLHDPVRLVEEIALTEALLSGLGHAPDRVRIIAERDPEIVEAMLYDRHEAAEIARTAFAHPGRRAEFLVFPTSSEYVELDAKDVRLNAGHPVDNSPEMGEVGFGAAQNGCNPEPNGRNPGFTPPVSTPGLDIDHVTEETTDAPVDNSAAGGRDGQAPPQPNPKNLSALRGHGFSPADAFASIGHILAPTRIDDEGLTLLGREIVAVSPTRVLNPTAYVVTQIRDTRSRSEWVSRAWVIAANVAMSRLENGGNA